jgi:RND family efflux transporter MFP subunit
MSESASPTATLVSMPRALDRAPIVRRRRRRWIWWVVALVLLAAGGAVAMRGRPAEVQASNVQLAYPSAQYAQLTASGYVVAQRRAAVSSKASGRLVELRVREGSAVKAGELIARIDASDMQAAVGAAVAGVRQAEGALKQAEAALQQARVEQANAEADLARAQGLQGQGFVSPQALDGQKRRVDAARAGVAAAQASIAAAQGALAGARAQVKVQQVNRDNTEIRAPFDGVVLVKNANVGDMITPFSSAGGTQGAVVTIADMSTLEVEADVSESNVGKVKVDQPVEIVLDALPEVRFAGRVVRIVPTVDRAKATVMTKIRFEKIDPRVLPEMSAKVQFLSQPVKADEQQPVTAVSPKAVVERDGRKVVFRIAGNAVEVLPVETGRTLGDLVEVRGGALQPGERLVLTPGAKLAAGSKVAVAGK